jgi:hypothetical protein
MQPNPHPMAHPIDHPAFCHLARAAAIGASTRTVRHEHRGAFFGTAGADDMSIAHPQWRPIGHRLDALRTALHLPLPRANIRTAYAAIASKAVTIITVAWRARTRRACLDPVIGAPRWRLR